MSLSGCHLSPQHDVITVHLSASAELPHSFNQLDAFVPMWGSNSRETLFYNDSFVNLHFWAWFCFYSPENIYNSDFTVWFKGSRPALIKNSTLFHSGSKLITQLQLRLIFFLSSDCSSLNHLAVSFTVELFSAIKGQTRCSLIKLVYQGGKMRRACTVVFSL